MAAAGAEQIWDNFGEMVKEGRQMEEYTREELSEALRAIQSVIGKCEKMRGKFKEGSSHYSLLKNRLNAMYIAKALIEREMGREQEK